MLPLYVPNNLKNTVKHVCTDRYGGFVNTAVEVCGQQQGIVARYHVAKLYRQPWDALRVKEIKRLQSD